MDEKIVKDSQGLAKDLVNDCISRQAAIDEIDEWIKAFRENGHKESAADACLIQDGIIQLPSAQPEKRTIKRTETRACDLISRAAAIDELNKGAWGVEWDKTLAKTMIESLPSAQPEIVRCKDCKHNKLPSTSGNANCEIYYGMTNQDGFCHMAERRTDEQVQGLQVRR